MKKLLENRRTLAKRHFIESGILCYLKIGHHLCLKNRFCRNSSPPPRKVVSIKLSIPVMYTLEGLPNFRFYKSQLSLVKRGSQIFSEKINKQEPQESSRQKFKLIKTRLDEDRKTRNGKVLSYTKFYQIEDSKKKKDWIDEKAYQSLLEKDQITNHE